MIPGGKKFENHKESLKYIEKIFKQQSTDNNIDLASKASHDLKLNNLGSSNGKAWAGRLAWLGHLLDVQKVTGSNPVRPILHQFHVERSLCVLLLSEKRTIVVEFYEQSLTQCFYVLCELMAFWIA